MIHQSKAMTTRSKVKKSNLGTSLPRKGRCRNPMQEYDQLPVELREWVRGAALLWRPKSVQRSFDKALAKTGNPIQALAELDRIEAKLLAKDAGKVWAFN